MFSCSKESIKEENTQQAGSKLKAVTSTSGFKGVNWADARDNYNSGWVLPSGTNASMNYSTLLSNGKKICQGFVDLGANTVRIPINPPTVSQWWGTYKAVVDAPLSLGMKVIIACWTESSSVGTVTNSTNFYAMWTTVINTYGSNSNVYFEILNEPYGYSKSAWLSLCSTWLSKYSSVPRGRVLVGGTGYDDHVSDVGGDRRVSGCLLSQHIYPWWGNYTTDGQWRTELANRVGSYASRTIVTEYGAPMTTGENYAGSHSGNVNVCFMYGIPDQCRNSGMGSCYWPGLRDGDSYSLTTLNYSTYVLTTNNSSGLFQVRWGWGY